MKFVVTTTRKWDAEFESREELEQYIDECGLRDAGGTYNGGHPFSIKLRGKEQFESIIEVKKK